jgi:hypothetical protein
MCGGCVAPPAATLIRGEESKEKLTPFFGVGILRLEYRSPFLSVGVNALLQLSLFIV